MLHIVNKSPFEKNSLRSCLRMATAGDKILLIEDGVYAGLKNTILINKIKKSSQLFEIYVLLEDLQARGINQTDLFDGISGVNYEGFVHLTVESDKVQSWL